MAGGEDCCMNSSRARSMGERFRDNSIAFDAPSGLLLFERISPKQLESGFDVPPGELSRSGPVRPSVSSTDTTSLLIAGCTGDIDVDDDLACSCSCVRYHMRRHNAFKTRSLVKQKAAEQLAPMHVPRQVIRNGTSVLHRETLE